MEIDHLKGMHLECPSSFKAVRESFVAIYRHSGKILNIPMKDIDGSLSSNL